MRSQASNQRCTANHPATMADRLETLFRARPGRWIDGVELAEYGGCYAWRSRLTDLRHRGMAIENRQRKVTTDGGRVVTVSEYRFVPRSLLDFVAAETQETVSSDGHSEVRNAS